MASRDTDERIQRHNNSSGGLQQTSPMRPEDEWRQTFFFLKGIALQVVSPPIPWAHWWHLLPIAAVVVLR